jgi:hypothetical protein
MEIVGELTLSNPDLPVANSRCREFSSARTWRAPRIVCRNPIFVLQLNNHDFDGRIPDIDILMPGSGSIGTEPVSLPGLPLMHLALAGILKDFHRSATRSDNYARVLVSM